METKEAIEFIESKKPSNFTGYELNNVSEEKITEDKLCRVIELLQRGEKYEAMWWAFYDKYDDECWDVPRAMDDVEEKYFPKEEDNEIS